MKDQFTKQAAIEEITSRLIAYYNPLRIYLFGSEARGDAGPDSDLDFCVVLPDDAPRGLYGPGVRRALRGIGTAVDVVRFPLTDFEGRAAHVISSLPATVMREGRLLYDAGRLAA